MVRRFRLVALSCGPSTEWWINYATAIIAAAGFGLAWSLRHRKTRVKTAATLLLLSTTFVLALYLLIRLQTPGRFFRPGAEEELLITYQNLSLIIEDVIVNFFTLLYMSLTNYLPSFVTASNSLTYVWARQRYCRAATGMMLLINNWC